MMTEPTTNLSCLVMAASRRGVDDPVARIQGLSHKCLVTLDGQDGPGEFLALGFAEGTTVYVPVARIDLVQR